MGSVASLAIPRSAASSADPGAVRAARAWLERVETALSPHRADSDLRRWWSGHLELAESPMLAEVVGDCRALTRLTDGAFQPAGPSGRYDPTGYVKGWAIRRAITALADWGVTDAALGVGGDVQTVGHAAGGRPWRVAVADPADEARIVAIVTAAHGAPRAVATSGAAQRGEHIWPTGPTRPGHDTDRPASVTVLGADLGTADAFATAVWAAARSRPLGQAWPFLAGTGYEAVAVDRAGRTHSTPGAAAWLAVPAAAS